MDEIKIYYINDEFFSIPFESLSKEARIANEIEKLKFFKLKDEILYYNVEFVFPSLENIDSIL